MAWEKEEGKGQWKAKAAQTCMCVYGTPIEAYFFIGTMYIIMQSTNTKKLNAQIMSKGIRSRLISGLCWKWIHSIEMYYMFIYKKRTVRRAHV